MSRMINRNPRIKRNIEVWRPVKGFPDYEISCFGKVRSLERCVECEAGLRFHKERILKPGIAAGYCQVTLVRAGVHICRHVHILVIENFGKLKPSPKHECNHKDGIKSNNWNINLEWMTHKENIQHAHFNSLV